jgi:hypothetical protein
MNKGQPRRFATGDELVDAMKEYLEYAEQNGRFPSIAGFCVRADLTYETFGKCKEYYPEHHKKCWLMLEEAVLSLNEKLNVRIIFYLKNKFNYKDVTEQTIKVHDPIKTVNLDKLSPTELATMEAILQKANDDPNAK